MYNNFIKTTEKKNLNSEKKIKFLKLNLYNFNSKIINKTFLRFNFSIYLQFNSLKLESYLKKNFNDILFIKSFPSIEDGLKIKKMHKIIYNHYLKNKNFIHYKIKEFFYENYLIPSKKFFDFFNFIIFKTRAYYIGNSQYPYIKYDGYIYFNLKKFYDFLNKNFLKFFFIKKFLTYFFVFYFRNNDIPFILHKNQNLLIKYINNRILQDLENPKSKNYKIISKTIKIKNLKKLKRKNLILNNKIIILFNDKFSIFFRKISENKLKFLIYYFILKKIKNR